MKWSCLWLFLSGFFFGGTVDHVIFAIMKSPSPYGIRLGITGNWLMALLDLIIAFILFVLFKHKNKLFLNHKAKVYESRKKSTNGKSAE